MLKATSLDWHIVWSRIEMGQIIAADTGLAQKRQERIDCVACPAAQGTLSAGHNHLLFLTRPDRAYATRVLALFLCQTLQILENRQALINPSLNHMHCNQSNLKPLHHMIDNDKFKKRSKNSKKKRRCSSENASSLVAQSPSEQSR